mmetsp:Transcript_103078/g.274062  ORF Transcript_103078/g.274062 Transcript_103078/m.274062 type:complete len:105 (-) Transcript_103078:23-337(-)
MASLAGRAFMEHAGRAKGSGASSGDEANDRERAGGSAKSADCASAAHSSGTETLTKPAAVELTPPTVVPDAADEAGVDVRIYDVNSDSESSTSSEEDEDRSDFV